MLVSAQWARAKASGDVAAAHSHQTTSNEPSNNALPVIRVRIDVIDVS